MASSSLISRAAQPTPGALASLRWDHPDLRPWIHSLKVFGAAMLALYAALALGLPRPYWAMATVYLVSSPQAGATYVVMASRLPLRSYRRIPSFLRGTWRVRRQLATADGLVGYSLDAKVLARTFWTLSAWRDQHALDSFAGAEPHRSVMAAIRPHMAPTTFVTWTSTGAGIPVTWETARDHLNREAGQQ
jgi:hypothetical protein